MERVIRGGCSLASVMAALLCCTGTALAYEDQISAGVGLGYANESSGGLPQHGLLVSAEVAEGLSDIWTLRVAFGAAHHPASDGGAWTRLLLGAELLYLVDVFEWVPYVGLGLDGVASLRAGARAVDLGVHPVLGVDYLWSRDFVLGFWVRPVFVVTQSLDAPYFACSLVASWLFDT